MDIFVDEQAQSPLASTLPNIDVENIARGWNGGPVFPLHIQTSGQEASNDFLLRVGGDVHTCPHQVHRLEGINW